MSAGPAELRLTEDADATDVARAYAELSPETSRSRTLVWQDPVPTAAAGATMTGMEYMRAVVEAKVLYRGRRQATSEASLTAADSGKLLAHGVATCMILGGV
jgi:hypothetical protein